ncbi:hypothetical protein D9613_007142 [Agrocybe pediades]|uniref:RING-type domain-containing protein n=1 Tax=Agrocybe pediades TaxID=84607 RepID=A0A8H4VID3_9AGAR|nr:hypothetical protein D9613_007142 [Agrocybe pediades]KAF9560123.1 hypothetical protein CPC08DRAFT_818426 [Agrocybe pediades]
MVSPCSICLSPFKDPVCLPCGHLYCKKCLTEHVNIPSNRGMTSNCPDCRSTFNITIPDLTYLPEKYHPFISHAVRRVYIDMESDSALQRKLKQAEAKLLSKAKSEEALLKKCESLAAAVSAHRAGEAEAQERIYELEEKIEDLEDDYKGLRDRYREQELENLKLLKKQREQKAQIAALQKSLEATKLTEIKARVYKPKNTSSQQRLSDGPGPLLFSGEESDSSFTLASSPIQRPVVNENSPPRRFIKPLPRRRVIRARDEDSVSMTLAPLKRARMFST